MSFICRESVSHCAHFSQVAEPPVAFDSNSGTFLRFSPRPLLPNFLSLFICDCQNRGPAFSLKIVDFGVGETAKATIFAVLFKPTEPVAKGLFSGLQEPAVLTFYRPDRAPITDQLCLTSNTDTQPKHRVIPFF